MDCGVSTEEVLVARAAPHVALVTLNRPAIANAVDIPMTRSLTAAIRDVESDPDTWVAILAGAGGRVFCAGADLNVIANGDRDLLYTDEGGFAGFTDYPREKLWIAAVDGPAMAGGFEIALACDFIIASAKARFGLPEVRRGMVAAAGGLFRLPRRIARGKALEMIVTGESVTAEEARAIGLVDKFVPEGGAIDDAIEFASRVCRNAPIAVRESLGVARAAFDHSEVELRRLSQRAAASNSATDDFQEGPRAFLEKRAPAWRAR